MNNNDNLKSIDLIESIDKNCLIKYIPTETNIIKSKDEHILSISEISTCDIEKEMLASGIPFADTVVENYIPRIFEGRNNPNFSYNIYTDSNE